MMMLKTKAAPALKNRWSALLLICLSLLFLFTGCGKKTVKPAQETPSVPDEQEMTGVDIEIPVPPEPEPEPLPVKTLVDILLEEADKFRAANEMKQGLMVLEQALNQADSDQIPVLIEKIESLAMNASPEILEDLLGHESLAIPEPILLYWAGVNHSMNQDYHAAKLRLNDLVNRFPGHVYHTDALELVALIKKATFRPDTVGCILPLSGKYAAFGEKALKGIHLGLHEFSAQAEHPYKILIKDSRSDPEHAAVCVKELESERVAGIIGPLLNAVSAGEQSQKSGIPMIAMTQNSEFSALGDFVFSNFFTPQMQARTLVSYAMIELGIDRFAVLYPDEPYGKRYMNLFWDAVESFGGHMSAAQSYNPKNTDFTTPIQKISGEFYPIPEFLKPPKEVVEKILSNPVDEQGNVIQDPDILMGLQQDGKLIDPDAEPTQEDDEEKIVLDFDAIFIPDSPGKISMILPQLAFNDVTDVFLLGTNLWHHDRLITQTKGYHSHAVITDGFLPVSNDPRVQQFTDSYRSMYGGTPGTIEATAYDTAQIFFTMLSDETIDSQESLRDGLLGGRVFEGVTGKTIFDQAGDVHKELFLITIKNQKFVEINR